MVDEETFAAFARARTPAMLRAAYLLCGNHHDAEDLVQETLAKVYVAWGRKGVANPVAYARTTLTHTFISSRRKLSSTERPSDTLPDGPALSDDRGQRLDLVAQLRLLPPLDRAVLVLRFLEDLSVRDTAVTLGLTETVVRTRSKRALARVRLRMDDAALTPSHS